LTAAGVAGKYGIRRLKHIANLKQATKLPPKFKKSIQMLFQTKPKNPAPKAANLKTAESAITV
jgi:hypothetical protein